MECDLITRGFDSMCISDNNDLYNPLNFWFTSVPSGISSGLNLSRFYNVEYTLVLRPLSEIIVQENFTQDVNESIYDDLPDLEEVYEYYE